MKTAHCQTTGLHSNPNRPSARINAGVAGTRTYLQGGEHHHLLLGAFDLLQQDGPLGLLIQLVHPDGIILQGSGEG